MTSVKVHFTQGDMINWAVDADLRHVRHALGDSVIESSLGEADLIFASWWAPLIDIDPVLLRGKRVLCCMHGDLHRFLMTPAHRTIFDLVSIWMARSHKTKRELEALGYRSAYVPYWENTDEFSIIPAGTASLDAMAERLGPRNGRYLIANFGRDSEGSDLTKPKLVKGPDMFAQIMEAAHARGLPVEAVLAGPRRHWLRRRLERTAVPYRLVGDVVESDDLAINTLSRDEINLLYNLVDLTVVSSRSEGGPLAVCEAPLAGCKLISTPVGMAPECLPKDAVFNSCKEAVDIIEKDIRFDSLKKANDITRAVLASHNSTQTMRAALDAVFSAAMRQEPRDRPLSRIALLVRKTHRRAKRLFVRSGNSKAHYKVGFGKHLMGCTNAYCAKRIIDLFGDNDKIVDFSSQEKADVMFLDVLADYPFEETSLSSEKYFLVLARSYDDGDIAKIIDNVSSANADKRFAGTLSPSMSFLGRLATLGFSVPKPILAPPIATGIFGGDGEPEAFLSVGGSSEANYSALSSCLPMEFRRVETSTTPLNPIAHVELGSDLCAIRRARSAVANQIPVAYHMSKDLEIVVSLGGLPFDGMDEVPSVVAQIVRQRPSFSSLSVPMNDDRQLWLKCIQSA